MRLKNATLVIALVITVLTLTASLVSGQGLQDRQSSIASGKTIAGVWKTVVTPRNCQTGDPVAPPFPGLFTFNKGGTMSEYGIGPGSSPALRSPGHGVWKREHGGQEYSFAFTFYRYNSTGVFIGSQKITATLELGASGDEFTTNSSIEVFDANDNLIGTGCATTTATRFD